MLHSSPSATVFNWNLLALSVAAGLLYALGVFVLRLDLAGHGLRHVILDGCTAHTWRDPVSGRDQAIGGSQLDTSGRPLCR